MPQQATAADKAAMLAGHDVATFTPAGDPHPGGTTVTIAGMRLTDYIGPTGSPALVFIAGDEYTYQGGTLEVNGVIHTVEEVEPDDIGFFTLTLRKQ